MPQRRGGELPQRSGGASAHREGKPCVVVLDNASFHTAEAVREREAQWERRGMRLYRLPAYCVRT